MSYYKEHYAVQKVLHRCVQCGKQDAYTLNGRPYCAKCAEWRRKYYLKRSKRPEIMDRAKECYGARRKELKEKGLCTQCGRKTTPPYVLCKACRAKNRIKYRETREPYMLDETLCARCHKRPHLEGKKMCAECYESFMRVQKLGAAARRGRCRNGATVCD